MCALETGSDRYIHTYIGLVRVGFIIVIYFEKILQLLLSDKLHKEEAAFVSVTEEEEVVQGVVESSSRYRRGSGIVDR